MRLMTQMANASLELVADDFAGKRGPFGGRWAAKKEPDGRAVGQGRTGRLAKYRIKRVDCLHFMIGSDAPYAGFFHGGTKRMRARPTVPDAGRLPAEWRGSFQKIWGTHCRLVLGGGR